jgi:hypothetical protein
VRSLSLKQKSTVQYPANSWKCKLNLVTTSNQLFEPFRVLKPTPHVSPKCRFTQRAKTILIDAADALTKSRLQPSISDPSLLWALTDHRGRNASNDLSLKSPGQRRLNAPRRENTLDDRTRNRDDLCVLRELPERARVERWVYISLS